MVVVPLARAVFSGITGGVAYATFKKLWDLPRKDVDDVEVALLQSALQAVIDSHKRTLKDKAIRLAKDERGVVQARIKEFEKTHDALRYEYPGYAAQTLTKWGDNAGWFGARAEAGYPDSTRISRRGIRAIMFEIPTTIEFVAVLGRIVPGPSTRLPRPTGRLSAENRNGETGLCRKSFVIISSRYTLISRLRPRTFG